MSEVLKMEVEKQSQRMKTKQIPGHEVELPMITW